MTIRVLVAALVLSSLAAAIRLRADTQPQAGQPAPSAKAEGSDRPLVAIWRRHDGQKRNSEAPYLRFAIWNDGRVLVAKDPAKWGHELLRGKISADRVARLKKAIGETGVFDLKGTCYLVPGAPCDCLLVDLGEKRQMLYWDEVETPGYGINIDPKPHHLEFKRSWKLVNHLGLMACPDQGEAVNERFPRPAASWYLKRAIQSE